MNEESKAIGLDIPASAYEKRSMGTNLDIHTRRNSGNPNEATCGWIAVGDFVGSGFALSNEFMSTANCLHCLAAENATVFSDMDLCIHIHNYVVETRDDRMAEAVCGWRALADSDLTLYYDTYSVVDCPKCLSIATVVKRAMGLKIPKR